MWRTKLAIALPVAFLIVLRARAASPPNPSAPISPSIFANRVEGERASFLVVFREKADLSGARGIEDRGARRRFVYEALRARADASQANLAARLRRDGIPFRSHYLVNMLEVEADEAVARDLAGEPGVLTIAANRPAALRREPPPGFVPRAVATVEWNIAHVGAPELWSRGFAGQGIVIGIADTGVQWTHPALRDRYRGWDGTSASHAYNWHDAIHTPPITACGSDSPEPCDDQGHGTSVAGLAVGDDGGENRIGVAPAARWIGCRNMEVGMGTPARYVECFEFFLAPTDENGGNPRPELGADVVNNSWTCPEDEGCTDPDVLRPVVEALRAAGIAQSFAAGNSGPDCGSAFLVPAIYEAAFAVGATNQQDGLANFSARGPVVRDGSNRIKPDIVAPGVGVRSSQPSPPFLDPYTIFGGTSGASPHVAGAFALLWSALPHLAGRVEETEELLEGSAVPLTMPDACNGLSGSEVPNPFFGWGRLDVGAAYTRATLRFAPVPAAGARPETRALPPRR
jgi:subtilisin family serine protease